MNEALGLMIGTAGQVIALLLFVVLVKGEGGGWYAVPIVGAVLWREYIFAGMRAELDQWRKGAER